MMKNDNFKCSIHYDIFLTGFPLITYYGYHNLEGYIELFQTQIRYCWNNPVRYIDPTGQWGSEKDFYVAYCIYLGGLAASSAGLPAPIAGLVGIGAGILGDIYWDYCMALDWYYSNFCEPISVNDYFYTNCQ